jgi:antitoxin component YwqK of YwqJK toxin-antitoxin module
MGEIEKKGKEWKYWYQNGQISRIENYRFIKDKNPYDLPDGKWTYFNEEGKKYRKDIYMNGVYNWLINNGIESGRLEFTGYGKNRPLYKDTDERSRAQNRRVEVKIIDRM